MLPVQCSGPGGKPSSVWSFLQRHLHAFASSPGLTCSKALVGHVKEGHVALDLAQVCYLLPLLRGGVDPGGVVRTACGSSSTPCVDVHCRG
jgi:hypothetical protein